MKQLHQIHEEREDDFKERFVDNDMNVHHYFNEVDHYNTESTLSLLEGVVGMVEEDEVLGFDWDNVNAPQIDGLTNRQAYIKGCNQALDDLKSSLQEQIDKIKESL